MEETRTREAGSKSNVFGYVYIREMFQSNIIISACSFDHPVGSIYVSYELNLTWKLSKC